MLRTPLGAVSGNRPRNHELTPYQRGLIIEASVGGAKPSKIGQAFRVSKEFIRITLRRAALRPDGASQPRSGRPKCYTDRYKCQLI